MAFTKETIYDALTIRATGHIEIRIAVTVYEDGVEMGTKFHRRSLTPGDDISSEPNKIQQVAALFWTPAIIAAAQAAKQGNPI